MAPNRRGKLDDDLARKCLEKHAPIPKPQQLEPCEKHKRMQKDERRLLAKPLLKGVE